MPPAEYRKAQRSLNTRIVSLGDDLWQANQELRAVEAEKGLKPALGPDSDGAFVDTLLKLYIAQYLQHLQHQRQ